jgi:hypothetical protein
MKRYAPHPSDIAKLRGDRRMTYGRAKYIWRLGYMHNVTVPRQELDKIRNIIEEYSGIGLQSDDAMIDVNARQRWRDANLYFKDPGLATYVVMSL